MSENKICPNCMTENKGLDLIETEGIYICSKCKKLINTKINEVLDSDKTDSDDDK